ncbi:MprA protease, GlyGly-CTERM protein-sorting domain-containing form [Ruegeria atlantica]|uniref:MprA protease, GlyGly-CTERM protein-sorting domain-containing form n=1 Tax=Ruegeria atlantica TaxID=81569 RepID=UPI001480FB40|nr:MprA protease, GlyGly-CTERM protein-sorting domain-containing form [Ruegeria atlantica]
MSYKDEFQARAAYPAGQIGLGHVRAVYVPVFVIAVLVLVAVSIWPVQALALNEEGGLFETISAAALFAAGLAALRRYTGITRLYIALVCLLLAERELEAEIYSVDSLPYWLLSSLDSLLDMTLVRVVLAVVVIGGVLWHGVPTAWQAAKRRAPFFVIFVLAGLLAVTAQLLEEVSGIYQADLSAIMTVRFFVLEETLEMFFSIGILASVLIGWPKSDAEEKLNDLDLEQQPDAR